MFRRSITKPRCKIFFSSQHITSTSSYIHTKCNHISQNHYFLQPRYYASSSKKITKKTTPKNNKPKTEFQTKSIKNFRANFPDTKQTPANTDFKSQKRKTDAKAKKTDSRYAYSKGVKRSGPTPGPKKVDRSPVLGEDFILDTETSSFIPTQATLHSVDPNKDKSDFARLKKQRKKSLGKYRHDEDPYSKFLWLSQTSTIKPIQLSLLFKVLRERKDGLLNHRLGIQTGHDPRMKRQLETPEVWYDPKDPKKIVPAPAKFALIGLPKAETLTNHLGGQFVLPNSVEEINDDLEAIVDLTEKALKLIPKLNDPTGDSIGYIEVLHELTKFKKPKFLEMRSVVEIMKKQNIYRNEVPYNLLIFAGYKIGTMDLFYESLRILKEMSEDSFATDEEIKKKEKKRILNLENKKHLEREIKMKKGISENSSELERIYKEEDEYEMKLECVKPNFRTYELLLMHAHMVNLPQTQRYLMGNLFEEMLKDGFEPTVQIIEIAVPVYIQHLDLDGLFTCLAALKQVLKKEHKGVDLFVNSSDKEGIFKFGQTVDERKLGYRNFAEDIMNEYLKECKKNWNKDVVGKEHIQKNLSRALTVMQNANFTCKVDVAELTQVVTEHKDDVVVEIQEERNVQKPAWMGLLT